MKFLDRILTALLIVVVGSVTFWMLHRLLPTWGAFAWSL